MTNREMKHAFTNLGGTDEKNALALTIRKFKTLPQQWHGFAGTNYVTGASQLGVHYPSGVNCPMCAVFNTLINRCIKCVVGGCNPYDKANVYGGLVYAIEHSDYPQFIEACNSIVAKCQSRLDAIAAQKKVTDNMVKKVDNWWMNKDTTSPGVIGAIYHVWGPYGAKVTQLVTTGNGFRFITETGHYLCSMIEVQVVVYVSADWRTYYGQIGKGRAVTPRKVFVGQRLVLQGWKRTSDRSWVGDVLEVVDKGDTSTLVTFKNLTSPFSGGDSTHTLDIEDANLTVATTYDVMYAERCRKRASK